MPKRKDPVLSPAEQFKKFVDAARKAQVTSKEEKFEGASKKVALPNKKSAAKRVR